MHRAVRLADTPLVQVFDASCRTPQSGYDAWRQSHVTQVIVPRQGVFGVQRERDDFVIHSGCAFLIDLGDAFRTRHPGPNGDDCTDVVPAPEVDEEWRHRHDRRLARLTPARELAVAIITRAVLDPDATPLETEERALLLLAVLAPAFRKQQEGADRVGSAQRARVDRVRALLASAPTNRWNLAAIAAAVHCSPFQLSREFRKVTSETISHYLLRLRLGIALERLALGETSLSALAVETGFAHHSHFSLRFRRVFGMTPAAARETLTSRKIDQVRSILAAG